MKMENMTMTGKNSSLVYISLLNFLHHSIVFNGLSLSVNGRAGHWGGTGYHSSK